MKNTLRVTEGQMAKIHGHLFKKYPWLQRKNDAYTARAVTFYDVTYDTDFENDIKEALAL